MEMKNLFAIAILSILLVFSNTANATIVSTTANSPADTATICGYPLVATISYTPKYATGDGIKNCTLLFGSVSTGNSTKITNNTANTFVYTVPSPGTYLWSVTCADIGTELAVSAERTAYMTIAPCNVNKTEQVGSTILTFGKGVTQLGAKILDTSNDPSFGVMDIGALIILFGFFVWAARSGALAKRSMT